MNAGGHHVDPIAKSGLKALGSLKPLRGVKRL
jgi:hypothetical protein